MSEVSPTTKDLALLLQLMGEFRRECIRLQKDLDGWKCNVAHLPSNRYDRNLWGALLRTFQELAVDYTNGAIADVGINTFDTVKVLCRDLSSVTNQANVDIQIAVAEALKLDLRERFFWSGLTWSKNRKSISFDDLALIPEALICGMTVALSLLNPTIVIDAIRTNDKYIGDGHVSGLILRTAQAASRLREFKFELGSYESARISSRENEMPAFGAFLQYPNSSPLAESYQELKSFCESEGGTTATRLLCCGEKLSFPESEDAEGLAAAAEETINCIYDSFIRFLAVGNSEDKFFLALRNQIIEAEKTA